MCKSGVLNAPSISSDLLDQSLETFLSIKFDEEDRVDRPLVANSKLSYRKRGQINNDSVRARTSINKRGISGAKQFKILIGLDRQFVILKMEHFRIGSGL